MASASKIEKLFIDGPAGRLEAILEPPRGGEAAGVAVVCHPHPQHGGTMLNKVVHTLARAFNDCDIAVVRFNFRGTGESDGQYDNAEGEVDDTHAVIDWAKKRYDQERVWLAGFSFGAAVAIRASLSAELHGLVSVAPAVRRFASGLDGQPECPWLILMGDEDELVDIGETIEWVNTLKPGPELLVIPGAEHFFHGRLVEMRRHVVDFIGRNQA